MRFADWIGRTTPVAPGSLINCFSGRFYRRIIQNLANGKPKPPPRRKNDTSMFIFPRKSLFLLLAFGLLLAFTSCDNEIAQDSILPELETEEEMPELLNEALPPPPDETVEERRRRPCFRFVFPIEIALRNGTIIVASDNEDLRAAYRRIRAAGAHANFVYPFDVQLANGNQVTIENFRTLRRLHRACRGLDEEPAEPCITINYPIDVISGDSTFTVNNRAELRRANQAFRPRGVSIVYPIDVTFTESGRVETINGDRELARLRNFCNSRGEDDDRGESCYRIMYPVDLNVSGIGVTVVSREGWRRIIRLRANRPNADVRIVYPITLIHRESGEEVIIADRDEWEGVQDQCE